MAKPVYGPSQEAENNPRRVFLKEEKKWIALGGEVKIERQKPKRSTVIPEATAAEYEQFKHLTKLVVDLENAEDEDL